MHAGQQIGDYRVTAQLGAGAMGEVFRARDTRLDRDVAIKVLPESFAEDAERVARFDREARLLASLNHPNIATVHGLEEHAGRKLLILEVVDGETLEQRLARGPLAIHATLNLASQICEALESAHAKGVIHRDLKPANVMIDAENRVKVLDFGLAKSVTDAALESGSAISRTSSSNDTQLGVLIGTAPYMSPEQALGKTVDHRTDIWAFGCVLYEMLTGTPAFGRGTITESLARVLERPPDFDSLPRETPAEVSRVLRRCLAKAPHDRLQHIGDARLELADAQSATPSREAPQGRARTPLAATAVVAAATLAFGFLAGSFLVSSPGDTSSDSSPHAITFPIIPPTGVYHQERNTTSVAISPDGTQVFYLASNEESNFSLILQDLTENQSELLVSEVTSSLLVSPNGESVGFGHVTGLALVDAEGGAPQPIQVGVPDNADIDQGSSRISQMRGYSWAEDGTIFYATDVPSGLWAFAMGSDATASQVSRPNRGAGELLHAWPHALPNGDVLFTVIRNDTIDNASLAVLDAATGEHDVLPINGTNPKYASSGHIVYAVSGALFAVRYDLERRQRIGEPVLVLDNVRTTNSGMAAFDLSDDGTLVYLTGGAIPSGTRIAIIDEDGSDVTPALPPDTARADYFSVRASPTENLLAVQMRNADSGLEKIYTIDLDRDGLREFVTDGPSMDSSPLFTPDGTALVYASSLDDAWQLKRVALNRRGESEELYSKTGPGRLMPMGWASDGQTLVFMEQRPGTNGDILRLSLDDRSVEVVLATEFQEGWGSMSSDGERIGYASSIDDGWQAYIDRYPALDRRTRISTNGAYYPLWSVDDGRVYFYSRDRRSVMAVDIGADGQPGRPYQLFEGSPLPAATPPRPYGKTRDGHIVTLLSGHGIVGRIPPPELRVVTNWHSELARLVPEDR